MVKRICKYPEKILLKETTKIDYQKMKDEIPNILKDMYDTMYFANGLGLSGNQIGLNLKISIITIPETDEQKRLDLILINPIIVEEKGEIIGEEGCLSFPGLFLKIKRAEKVKVRALNEKGLPIEIKTEGLLAKALQHEIDHLNGIVFIDRLTLVEKIKLKPKLLTLKKKWAKMDETKMLPKNFK